MARFTWIVLAAATFLASSPSVAHENFRIVGKVVKFEQWRLQVETAAGESFTITLQESTPSNAIRSRLP